ncbi:hypothetical protein JCM8097_008159 [Rhodosporidiobolus ruineniae]
MDLEDTSVDLSDLLAALPTASSRSSSLAAPTLSELPVELKIKVAEHVYALPLESEPGFHLSASPWTSVSKREKESLARLAQTSRLWHAICAPMLAREYTLTRPLLLDHDFLLQRVLTPHGHLVRRLDVGPEDLRTVGLIARVAPIIPLLPHLETLSLTAYNARMLPVLQLSAQVHTLELVLQSGYPEPDFFVPFAPHLRTLFFSTNDFRRVVGLLYDLPRVTSLHLASPSHHDLSIFHRLPLEHLSFADWEYRSPLSTGEGTNIARIV